MPDERIGADGVPLDGTMMPSNKITRRNTRRTMMEATMTAYKNSGRGTFAGIGAAMLMTVLLVAVAPAFAAEHVSDAAVWAMLVGLWACVAGAGAVAAAAYRGNAVWAFVLSAVAAPVIAWATVLYFFFGGCSGLPSTWSCAID